MTVVVRLCNRRNIVNNIQQVITQHKQMKHSRKFCNTYTCILISVYILNRTFCSSCSWIATVHVIRSLSSCMRPNIKDFENVSSLSTKSEKKTLISVLDVNCTSWNKCHYQNTFAAILETCEEVQRIFFFVWGSKLRLQGRR